MGIDRSGRGGGVEIDRSGEGERGESGDRNGGVRWEGECGEA